MFDGFAFLEVSEGLARSLGIDSHFGAG